ncbi:hypothetical protein [Campylobacter avium]|uniref:hypothetical protein n=1 Tax=Campylobacter avium TaxID=522485 RepID=UPI0011D06E92|nr:hypothetical protein [Campylobacter avium]HJE66444.1 hypothetical protein [Campylobacter avium]
MRQTHEFADNKTRIFKLFHGLIITIFLLIFITSCGYKDDPFYEIKDENSTVIEIKHYKHLNRW